jgi:hypothetical protein
VGLLVEWVVVLVDLEEEASLGLVADGYWLLGKNYLQSGYKLMSLQFPHKF